MKKFKKLFIPIALAFAMAASIILPVLADTYLSYYPTIITDTSGSTRTALPVITGIEGQDLIDAGLITSTGLDTRMRIGSTDIPYMMSTTQIPIATNLPESGQSQVDLYTSYSPLAANFNILMGESGYITIDDATSIELGNTFEIKTEGYFDTTGGADINILYKPNSFRTYVDGANNITSVLAKETGFPIVQAVNGGNDVVNQQLHTTNLPTGIEAGDLLLAFFVSDGNVTIAFPGGWTELFQDNSAGQVTFGTFYRIADGTEGATIVVETDINQMTAHTTYRITGYYGVPEVGELVTGNSANPDPPRFTPSWGTSETLWFAATGYDSWATVSAYPVNYTDGRSDGAVNLQGCGTGIARREREGTGEDPGTFTITIGEEWVANTVAIRSAPVVVASSLSSDEYIITTSLGNEEDFDDYATDASVAVNMGTGLIPVFLLEKQELTSATASVTFSNIDTLVSKWDTIAGVTSRHLVVGVNAASVDATGETTLYLRFNGDVDVNYNWQRLNGVAAAALADRGTAESAIRIGTIPGTTYADSFGGGTTLIPHAFNTTNHKATLSLAGAVENSVITTTGRWADASAIASMNLFDSGSDFATGSTFWLGVVDERYLVEEDLLVAAGTIDFDNISQDGGDLVAIGYSRGAVVAVEEEIVVELNADAVAASYNFQRLLGSGAVTSAAMANDNLVAYTSGSTATANAFGASVYFINQYAEGINDPHLLTLNGYHESTGATSRIGAYSGRRNNIAAVTRVEFYGNGAANFESDTLFSLYRVPRYTIDRQELTTATATITFADIPQGYDALQLNIYARTSAAAHCDGVYFSFNNDVVAANYDRQKISGIGAVVAASRSAATFIFNDVPAALDGANEFSGGVLTLPNYAKTDRDKHIISIDGCVENVISLRSGRWEDTSPITEIDLTSSLGGNFEAGSVFELVGIMPTNTFSIDVDGDIKGIANGNVTVADNTNDWILNQNDVMPYMDYYRASGQATHFTGSATSNINVGAIHNSAAKLWLSFWINLDKPHAFGDASFPVIQKWDGAAVDWLVVGFEADGRLRFQRRDGGLIVQVYSTENSWNKNQWYHILASISDVNGVRFRINNEVAITDADLSAAPAAGNIIIGHNHDPGLGTGTAGKIINVVMGTDDLTVAEELGLYNGIIPADANNIWYADEGTGVNIVDYGTDGDNGTADTAITWVGSGELGNNDALVRVWYQPNTMVVGTDYAGTADAGGTISTLIDAELVQAEDYWLNALLTITDTTDDLAPKGETSFVTDFNAAANRLTFAPSLTVAPDAGDTYTVDFATLVDRGASAQDARLTWGINTNSSITYGEIINYTATASATSGEAGYTTAEADMPAEWYGTGSNLVNLPLYSMFNGIAIETGIPTQSIYVFMVLIMCFAFITAGFVMFNSVMAGVVGAGIGLGIGAAMTVVPMWILMTYLVIALGLSFLKGRMGI